MATLAESFLADLDDLADSDVEEQADEQQELEDGAAQVAWQASAASRLLAACLGTADDQQHACSALLAPSAPMSKL